MNVVPITAARQHPCKQVTGLDPVPLAFVAAARAFPGDLWHKSRLHARKLPDEYSLRRFSWRRFPLVVTRVEGGIQVSLIGGDNLTQQQITVVWPAPEADHRYLIFDEKFEQIGRVGLSKRGWE